MLNLFLYIKQKRYIRINNHLLRLLTLVKFKGVISNILSDNDFFRVMANVPYIFFNKNFSFALAMHFSVV